MTFIDLPFATQSKVWRLSWLPRLVCIETDSVNGGFISRACLPSSFHVHQASRAFSITNYMPSETDRSVTVPFFNPELDTLVVSRPAARGFTAPHLSSLLTSLSAQHVYLTRSLTLMSEPGDATLDATLHHFFHVLVSATTLKSIMFYRESINGSSHFVCLVRCIDDTDQPPTVNVVTIDPDSPDKWGPRYHSLNPWKFDPDPLSKLQLHHAIVFAKFTLYEGGWRLLLPIPSVSQISCELVWFLAIYNAWLEYVLATTRRGNVETRSLTSHLSLAWQEDLRFMIDGICTVGLPGLGASFEKVDIIDEIIEANFHYIADIMDSQINGWWPNAKFQRQRAYRDAIKQGIIQDTYKNGPTETSQANTDHAGWSRWQENLNRWRRTFQL